MNNTSKAFINISQHLILTVLNILTINISQCSLCMGVYIWWVRESWRAVRFPSSPRTTPPPTSPWPIGWAGYVSPVKRSPARGGQWQSSHACQDFSACIWIPPPFKKDSHRRPLWIGTDSNTLPRDQNVEAGTENIWVKCGEEKFMGHI